jgi:large subunit ribosomal protein L18
MKNIKREKRERRHKRIRSTISGTATRPRISAYKSNKELFIQVIDDVEEKTLLSISTKKESGKTKVEKSLSAGKTLGKSILDAKITEAIFDRGGNRYTGRIKSFVEGLRESGLKI